MLGRGIAAVATSTNPAWTFALSEIDAKPVTGLLSIALARHSRSLTFAMQLNESLEVALPCALSLPIETVASICVPVMTVGALAVAVVEAALIDWTPVAFCGSSTKVVMTAAGSVIVV